MIVVGVDFGDSAARDLQPERLHHDAPSGKLRQSDARDRPYRDLRLRTRNLDGMVFRQRV